ncbi:MAG: Ubiquitin recognition factor in ER-associated degradation protein 1 [Alyxoria varia]|nr:MAG: Ubiquitin recognition factor in ER-associated degradation protein 1 [Alyxoria varia]
MATPFMFEDEDSLSMYQQAMMQRAGGRRKRFDEYYRCYPLAMMPGPDQSNANHGGKIFLPSSALDKLTRMHISYPMLFELINGAKEKVTHAGVLEFTAEEGKVYLPYWLMQTLLLETGDLLQIKSTDLPPGTYIKLKPQSTAFLDITDPKAVLERAFGNFSCLTVGDIFSFSYNDNIYEIEVLEVKPQTEALAICTLETDLSVDFDEPVGYVAPTKPTQKTGAPEGGKIHTKGTMSQAINYDSIAPSSGQAATGAKAVSSHFAISGQRLGNKRSNKNSGTSTPSDAPPTTANVAPARNGNGPQPLRLPPGKLFFGYEYVPPPKERKPEEQNQDRKTFFKGKGQNLRGKVVDADAQAEADSTQGNDQPQPKAEDGGELRGGRTLRDTRR